MLAEHKMTFEEEGNEKIGKLEITLDY